MFAKQDTTFQNSIDGNWGTFHTTAGKVNFLLTKARLGKTGTDPEWRLTKVLAPVREVLPIDHMDFNQLLQRDLDDHRISVDLIPYVLKSQYAGPAFFPPIVSILLPFNNNTPAEHFPSAEEFNVIEDKKYGAYVSGVTYGDAFKFEKLVNKEDGSDHNIKLGRLSWNNEKTKLVVMDGQHRAMALIAIYRTHAKEWRGSTGEKYETFYSERVTQLLHDEASAGRPIELDKIEFPVTICWFPDGTTEENVRPHQAARKLFVDINQNAKKPSQARLILLSDTELTSIFTRELLNRLRKEPPEIPPLPLYAIEYDNPDAEASRPARWSVLTNLDMLNNAVVRCAFGPKKFFDSMSYKSSVGKPNVRDMDAFMRERLDVKSLFTEIIKDGPRNIQTAALGNKNFPVYNHAEQERLIAKFMSEIGEPILNILGKVLPFKAHVDALKGVYSGWSTSTTNVGQLAKDALFEGMGIYWTLRDSHNYYTEKNNEAKRNQKTPPTQPEASKAWESLEKEKKGEFLRERARIYLARSVQPDDKQLQMVEDFYNVTNTQACQLGAFLTWNTLALRIKKESCSPLKLAEILINSWNESLASGPTATRNRRLVFSRNIENPLNCIKKLDTPMAVYYRYFWLELLCTDTAIENIDKENIDKNIVFNLRDSARKNYFDYIYNEQIKALRETMPDAKEEKREKEAKKQSVLQLKKSLKHWFGITDESFSSWMKNTEDSPSDDLCDEEHDEEGNSETYAEN